jgi:DAK2 domain fusion protein YloV
MLDSPAVRRGCRDVLDALGAARAEIDGLNVFPVPDGDTGTNLFLTVESALEELTGRPTDDDLLGDLRALAHGALLGARGNSGVILSQLLRGALPALLAGGVEPAAVAQALEDAASAGYAAVASPVEGTVLTVARAAATAAAAAVAAGVSSAVVLEQAAMAAHDALDRTPELLPALRDAGVVDAGGRGLTVVLDALVGTVTGRRTASTPPTAARSTPAGGETGDQVRHGRPGGPAFEVMYLLEADDAATERLRDELAALGDSLLVVGGDGLWNVHVHVDDVGAAVEAGIRAGRPYRIAVAHFGEQVARQQAARAAGSRAVLAMVPGAGLATLAGACGAVVVEAVDGRRPATRDVLLAVQQAHTDEVVVLPDDRDTVAVAEAAAEYGRAAGLRVAVIPTRAPVQVLAALAVHDPSRTFDDDVVAMTAAARATRRGAVTTAVREALTSAGVCHPGDVLGMVEDDVACIGSDVSDVTVQVLDRMLTAGGELVTVVLGAEAPVGLGDRLADHLRRTHVEVDVQVHDGGQAVYPVLLGVE